MSTTPVAPCQSVVTANAGAERGSKSQRPVDNFGKVEIECGYYGLTSKYQLAYTLAIPNAIAVAHPHQRA